MAEKASQIVLVQLLTLSRATAILLFICIALDPGHRALAAGLYVYALASDLADGILARRFGVVSSGGGALDRFADKLVVALSALYGAAAGVHPLPVALIILRSLLVLALRGVVVDGAPPIPPKRLLGTLTAMPVWVATLVLVAANDGATPVSTLASGLFWFAGGVSALSLLFSVRSDWTRISQTFRQMGP